MNHQIGLYKGLYEEECVGAYSKLFGKSPEAELESARETERGMEEDLKYLTERVGATEESARLRLRDDDLWLLDPASRFGEELEGEDGVRHWRRTAQLARAFGQLAANELDRANPAATQLIWDAADRAEEALRRAWTRLETAGAE